MKTLLTIALSVTIAMAWGAKSEIWLYPIVLVPVLWSISHKRAIAGLVIGIYYLVATRGFIIGIAHFFNQSLYFGACFWLLGALPHGLLGALCWFKSPIKRVFIGIPLLCILLIIPPMALLGWTHPLMASGLWFPYLGLYSLLTTLILMLVIAIIFHASFSKTKRLLSLFISSLIFVYSLAFAREVNIDSLKEIKGHHTFFYPYHSLQERLKQHWQMMAMLDEKVVLDVFPESVFGFADDFLIQQWQIALKDYENKTILIGGFVKEEKFQSVLYFITKDEFKVFYYQRYPMTFGMYRPFSKDGFQSNWFGESVFLLNQKRIGVAMCFEYVALLPLIQLALERPELIIAPANQWWATMQLKNAQQQSLKLAGRWLNIPIITAINGGEL